jgi:hypothetical protein
MRGWLLSLPCSIERPSRVASSRMLRSEAAAGWKIGLLTI